MGGTWSDIENGPEMRLNDVWFFPTRASQFPMLDLESLSSSLSNSIFFGPFCFAGEPRIFCVNSQLATAASLLQEISNQLLWCFNRGNELNVTSRKLAQDSIRTRTQTKVWGFLSIFMLTGRFTSRTRTQLLSALCSRYLKTRRRFPLVK